MICLQRIVATSFLKGIIELDVPMQFSNFSVQQVLQTPLIRSNSRGIMSLSENIFQILLTIRLSVDLKGSVPPFQDRVCFTFWRSIACGAWKSQSDRVPAIDILISIENHFDSLKPFKDQYFLQKHDFGGTSFLPFLWFADYMELFYLSP